ncbi:DUF2057 domain-containing protein [Ferrimonas gelatinilytica]|uniref:DUF2057 domain-containing protein n=1 Tax=Ferrimonas gelatinilytica TaxID=1255257 RepID=A0ABP9S0B0_9GAMM
MYKALVCLLALALSPALNAASLTIPLEFEFLAVNGEPIGTSMFKHKDNLNLVPGENRVALRYKDLVRETLGDGHSRVNSNPFVITFTIGAEEKYHLAAASAIRDLDQARRFADNPQVVLTDGKGNPMEFAMALTQGEDPGLLERMTGSDGPDLEEQAIAATATGGALAAAADTQSASAEPFKADSKPSEAATAPVTADPANPEAMLKYWWQQADEPTRKAFMSWAVQQL